MTTSVTDLEMLREAARLMRERANAATPGPWERFSDKVWSPVGDRSICYDCPDDADAEHIAAWHPVVALAVADWLDAEADLHYGAAVAEVAVRHVTEGQWEVRLTGSTLPQALAVARAYLRREP